MSPLDPSNHGQLEVRVLAIEELIKDIKKWRNIISLVLLGFFGLGIYQIPGYVKNTAIDAARATATTEATKVAKETTDEVFARLKESEIAVQMEKYRQTAFQAADASQKSAMTAEGNVKASNDLIRQLEEQRVRVKASLDALTRAINMSDKGFVVMRSNPLNFSVGFKDSETKSVDFEFPVSCAWYHVLNHRSASGDYSFELTTDGKRVTVKASNNSINPATRLTTDIQIFASKSGPGR